MKRLFLTCGTAFSIMVVLAPAHAAESMPTNQIPEPAAEIVQIELGDSLNHVLNILGEPRVDCPLQGGKRILIYEEGEIHLQDGKVTVCDMLTEQELAEKRVREQRKLEHAAAAAKKSESTTPHSDSNALFQEELRLEQAIANMQRDLLYSQKMAQRHMSNSMEAFSLMNRKAGASPRYDKNLADSLPNNSLAEFYRIQFNFGYFERKYARIPPAILTLKTLEREYILFIQEYERMLDLDQELQSLEKQLQQVKEALKVLNYRTFP